MTQSIFVNSGLSVTEDEIYQILNGRIRAIKADTTNEQVVIYLTKKDNTGDTNASTSEVLTLAVTDGKEAEAAEDIIKAISLGLLKNSQATRVSEGINSTGDVLGVQISTFTVANTDVAITGTAEDDFTFTLASATAGCDFSATLSMDDESHEFTVTGANVTATEAIKFDSTDFSAGAATIAITLTNPNQPEVSKTVSQAATMTS